MAREKRELKEPKKTTVKKRKEKAVAIKSDEIGFKGGISVDLDRKMNDGTILRDKLRSEIDVTLDESLRDQSGRIEKIPVWNRMYRGHRKDRPGRSNVATPIPRILTEAIVVRIFEGLYSSPKFWTATAVKIDGETSEEIKMWNKIALELENDMDWWSTDIDLKKKLFDPILQSVKIGRGLIMMWPKSKKRTVVRYASDKEIDNKNIKTFKAKNGQDLVKVVNTVSQQPDVFSISREDWVQSLDNFDLQKALLCGFRTYSRKPEIELRVKQGLYDSLETDRLMGGDQIDETKLARLESEKKELSDTKRDSFGIWQLHYRCDVDEDGEEDDIVVWFHPQSKAILRCIYNPVFAGFRPFIDFVYNPSEYSADGEGTCEILEKLVEEIDTMHNQRIDRISQINGPILFIRDQVRGLEDFEYRPRGVYRIDETVEDVIKEFRFSDQTLSNAQEEQHLIDLCMKAVGVTPDILGQPTAERPVFKEMASRQAEANKKFRFLNRLYRGKIEDIGIMYLEMSAQYQPTHSYTIENDNIQEQRIITYPFEYLRDRIKIKLSGSTELENEEVKRERAVQQYMILSKYYTDMTGMAQAVVNPNIPPDFKKWIIEVSKKSEQFMEKILQNSGLINAEDAVMSIDDVINIEKATQQPPPGMVPPGAQGQPGQQGSPMGM